MDGLKKMERSLKGALGQCEKALGQGEMKSSDCCPVLEGLTRTGHNGKIPHEN
jgi:hypothetical protein